MRRWAILLVAVVASACGRSDEAARLNPASAKDLPLVDQYLDAWSLMSKLSDPEEVRKFTSHLHDKQDEFDSALARLLRDKHPGAPARLVYSQVVQVSSFLDTRTDLGKEALALMGSEAQTISLDGDSLIFAGDLYLWWREAKQGFETFNKLQEWEKSAEARSTIIPMYEERARLHSQSQSLATP